jgi:hypothetical protein
MRTISVFALRTYLGASASEIAKIRALFPDYDGDEFPEAECARALLAIRQGNRRRDPITESHKAQAQAQDRTRQILGNRSRRLTRD